MKKRIRSVLIFNKVKPEIIEQMSQYQIIYSMSGLVLGFICIIGGIVISLLGVTGTITWKMKLLNVSSELDNAIPGVILFIVGIFIVWITRFSIKLKSKN